MAEKHFVVQGATCQCKFGDSPDKLKVLTQTKEYANDASGSQKLVASTRDIGATFEKNCFGSCSKKNNNSCTAVVKEWKDFFENVKLSNGGQVLLETSKATCPTGEPDCITIIKHGQTAGMSSQNVANANSAVSSALNPAVDINNINNTGNGTDGVIFQ